MASLLRFRAGPVDLHGYDFRLTIQVKNHEPTEKPMTLVYSCPSHTSAIAKEPLSDDKVDLLHGTRAPAALFYEDAGIP